MRRLIHPTISDIPRLKQIWCEGFPEDKQSGYCDFYFNDHFSPELSLAVTNGSDIESACHLFDCICRCANGAERRFLYFYAAATAKQYRGHGNLEYMLGGCLEYAAALGCSGIVTKSAEDIIYLYDRMGGRRIAPIHTYTACYKDPEEKLLDMTDCTYEAFSALRKAYLSDFPVAIHWTAESEKYMYKDIFHVGKILQTEYHGKIYYAVCTVETDCIIIRETNSPAELLPLLIDSVLAHLNHRGKVVLYSHKAVRLPHFSADTMYYGHYFLAEDFCGSEMLSDTYINLIAD